MRSREEVVARKVFDLISDMRLSPYYVGYYLAHTTHPNVYDMLREIMEATEETMVAREKEIKEMIING